MKKISLPKKFEVQEIKDNKNRAKVIIEPCYPGYGNTIGNALRRVLLSSLPGAAVVAVKIKGVHHEFSTIEFVKEDVVDIILNLKQLRLKMDPNAEMTVIELNASGKKIVTAKDIKTTGGIEVCNPELEIATLTDKKASLEMKIWVKMGRGYVLVDEHSDMEFEIDTIVVDSSYTPITNVALDVVNVRVGDRIDFDKMILDIETDGSITPKDAVIASTEILIDQFNFILDPSKGNMSDEDVPSIKEVEEEVVKEVKKDKKIKKDSKK
ncbi:MAG: DNA-directed RNA polymerase subunit alpha [Patescibacteria group bacterium]